MFVKNSLYVISVKFLLMRERVFVAWASFAPGRHSRSLPQGAYSGRLSAELLAKECAILELRSGIVSMSFFLINLPSGIFQDAFQRGTSVV